MVLMPANCCDTGTNAVRAASQSALACVMNCALVSGLVFFADTSSAEVGEPSPALAATLLPVVTIPVGTMTPTMTARRPIIHSPAFQTLSNASRNRTQGVKFKQPPKDDPLRGTPPTLPRFATLRRGAGWRTKTVRVDVLPPGVECQVDLGRFGKIPDADKRRRVRAIRANRLRLVALPPRQRPRRADHRRRSPGSRWPTCQDTPRSPGAAVRTARLLSLPPVAVLSRCNHQGRAAGSL